MDDLTIASDAIKDHIKHIQTVFERIKKGAMTLKAEKCEFIKEEIMILNHKVSYGKISPNQVKIKEVKKLKPPTDVPGIRKFTGFMNYFRRFIKNFAIIAAPIYDLLKKNKKFIWTDECQKAFEELKDKVYNAIALTYPKKGYQLILETDASDNGIGAVLKQINPELAHYKTKEARENGTKEDKEITKSEEEVIEFGSHSLTQSQRLWGSTQKELYMIYFYLKNWRHYIGNKPIIIRTDNTGVAKAGKMPRNQTMESWKLEIDGNYNIKEIQYIKGSTNNVSDWLSRHMGPIENQELIKPKAEIIKEMKPIKEPPSGFKINKTFNNKQVSFDL